MQRYDLKENSSKSYAILAVTPYPPEKDGIADYAYDLFNSLRDLGLNINIISKKDWNNALDLFTLVLTKARSSHNKIVHFQFTYNFQGDRYSAYIFPLLLLALRILRKRIVLTLHDVIPREKLTQEFVKSSGMSANRLKLKKLAFFVYTWLIGKLPHKVIVLDSEGRNVVIRDYKFDQSKVHTIPIGLKSGVPNEVNEHDEKKYVTFFGFIKKGKGLEDLIEVWKDVHRQTGAILQIVGGERSYRKDGLMDYLKARITELELTDKIIITGFLQDKSELDYYFKRSSAFVFPYKNWGDIAANSGAASTVLPYRRPIIVTNVPLFRSLINSGCVLVCEKENIADSLTSNIISALDVDEKCQKCLRNMDTVLTTLDWKNIANTTCDLYLTMVRSPSTQT